MLFSIISFKCFGMLGYSFVVYFGGIVTNDFSSKSTIHMSSFSFKIKFNLLLTKKFSLYLSLIPKI